MFGSHPDILIYSDANPRSGHHFEHLQYLLEHWLLKERRETLCLAADSRFLEYPRLAELVEAGARHKLSFEPVELLTRSAAGRLSLVQHSLASGKRLRDLINRVRPEKCLLTYFDHYQLPFAASLKFSFPVDFSGIYFRPSFHYGRIPDRRPIDFSERLKRLRQKLMLRAAMRNRHLGALFCLDPYSAPAVEEINPAVRAIPLPDPVVVDSARTRASHNIAGSLGIERGRIVLLMFGVLDARKGTMRTLEACSLLSAETAARLCIVFAGRIPDSSATLLPEAIERTGRNTPIQLLLLDHFLEEAEVRDLFGIADAILLPYQRFIGSSGVLLRAAAAGKPVIGSDYGLIGKLIEDNRLGIAVDSENPHALAAAITNFIAAGEAAGFDCQRARRLAEKNSPSGFAKTILDYLINRDPRRAECQSRAATR